MKKIGIVLILATGCLFWSCMKDGGRQNLMLYEGAAIVRGTESGNVVLEVLHDVLLITPQLSGNNLDFGDLLWVRLFVDETKQTSWNRMVVSEVTHHKKVGSCVAKPVGESDFTYPINRAVMWINNVENFWIFGFEQMAPEGQIFEYEMQFGMVENDIYPTVFLRSRRVNEVQGNNIFTYTDFGFDFTPFIKEYANLNTNTFTFRVRYLSGINADGSEIFTSFIQNPITVNIKQK